MGRTARCVLTHVISFFDLKAGAVSYRLLVRPPARPPRHRLPGRPPRRPPSVSPGPRRSTRRRRKWIVVVGGARRHCMAKPSTVVLQRSRAGASDDDRRPLTADMCCHSGEYPPRYDANLSAFDLDAFVTWSARVSRRAYSEKKNKNIRQPICVDIDLNTNIGLNTKYRPKYKN